MGSKGIKAIVLDTAGCTAQIEYADKDKFLATTRDYVKSVKQDPVGGLFNAIGTPGLVNMINGLGAMPTHNFSDGRWDKAESISGEKIAEIQKSRGGINGHRCMPGCVISCSNIINDEKGNYLTGSFEYETIALLGPNLEIDNPDTVAMMDRLCDDLGVDTIETGGMLGVCMEAGKIQFGDGEGALKLMQEMIDGTEFGKIIGNGAEYAGKYLGVKRIPVAKSQTMAGYDPRGLKGIGVTYATSPMGADHTAGNPIGNPTVDPYKKEGQVAVSAFVQPFMATCDSLGLCMHIFMPSQDPKNLAMLLEMIGAKFGGKWDADKLYEIGKQTLALEIAFNKGAGFTAKDDKLPDFMYEEVLPSTGCKFDITQEELKEALPY
jgi:aldehyde:ferredoxin oxidoreductase